MNFPPPTRIDLASQGGASLAEDAGAITILATLNQPARSGGVAVTLTVRTSGAGASTATEGQSSDFTLSPKTFTIQEGASFAGATLTIIDDIEQEGDETIVIDVTTTASSITTINGATVTILANDQPSTKTYKITSAVTANEGEDAELTITLGEDAPSGNLAFTVTPTYTSGTGKAVAADLGTVPPSVSVAADSKTATLTIPIARDAMEEGAETFTVAIAPATGVTGWTVASGGTASATVTITDTTEAVSFSMATYAVDEGDSDTVVVSRTGPTTEALAVSLSTANGTATSADYTALSSETVTIAAGSSSANVAIQTTDDDVDEGTGESFTVTIAAPDASSGYRLGTQSSATVTITDDDDAGVTVSKSALSVVAGETADYTIVLDTKPTHSVTIMPTSGATDKATVSGAVTFTTANWSTPQEITVTGVAAGNASITHAASSTDTNYQSSLSIDPVAVTVAAAPASTKTYAIAAAMAKEGQNAELTITLGEDAPTGNLAFTVTPAYTSGTGKAAAADVGMVPTSVSVSAGSKTATLLVPLARDADATESDETFTVAISTSVTGWSEVASGDGTATVTIEEATPTVQIASATYTVTEGSGMNAHIVVTKSGGIASGGHEAELDNRGITVPMVITPGSAEADADFTGVTFDMFIPDGITQPRFPITIINDDLAELQESFTVGFGTLATAAAGARTTTTVTIDDDDAAAARIAFGSSAASTAEHTASVDETVTGGTLDVPVTISHLPDVETTFTVEVVPDGTTAGSGDYSLSTATVTFGPTDSSKTKNAVITLTDDDAVEEAETINLKIADADSPADSPADDVGDHYTRHANGGTATVTINSEDDAGVTVSKSSLSVTATETGTYTVVLTSKPTHNVTITPTSDDTDKATVSAAVVFTTANWSTPKEITVTGVAAGNASITHAASSTDTNYQSSLSIGEVDVTVTAMAVPVVQWAQAAYSVTETDADQTLDLTINIDPALTGSLSLSQTGGDATAGTDWDFTTACSVATGTLSNASSATCSIKITGDDIAESDETIEITIGTGAGYTVGTIGATTVTIVDDDAPPAPSSVTLSVANASVAENVGTVTVTATLDNAAGSSGVSVRVAAGGTSTATATDDYTGLPATISIGDGDTTGTATLTIVDDDVDEDSETIVLTATASGLSGTGTTLTITDNDDAGVTVNKSSLNVTATETATYTVVLDTKPTHNVTVTPTSDDTDKATVSAAVVFTTANWSTPKEITVTGVAAGDAKITHAASSTDTKYPSTLTIGEVDVTVAAAELPTVSFEAASYEVREPADGEQDTLQIPLSCVGGDPTVSLQSADAGATFASDYVAPGSFKQHSRFCSAGDGHYIFGDNVLELRPEAFTVTILENPSEYQLGDITETTVTILDFHAPETLTINGSPEKTSSTITVKWNHPPYKWPPITEAHIWAQNVDDATDNVYKTVDTAEAWSAELSATLDGLKASTTYVVRIRARNTLGIRGAWSEAVEVTTAAAQQQIGGEPERLRRTYSVNTQAAAAEGGDAELTLTLSHAAPAEGVEFTVTAGYGDGATSGDVESITSPVTIGEGNDTLTIAVPTVDDRIDEEDETFTVTIATGAAGWEKESEGRDTATVTIIDDDTAGVTVEPLSLTVAKGGTGNYTVILDSRPTHDVTVTPSVARQEQDTESGTPPVGTVDKAAVSGALVFTPLNWDAAQPVTVTGIEEGSAALTHAASSEDANYGGLSVSPVAVTVVINTAPTVNQGIAGWALPNESAGRDIDLSGVFNDADDDELTVTAESSNDSIAAVSVASDYSTLTVTAQARGTAIITVTAVDGNGGTVSDTFTVTVKSAPVVDSAIADVTGLEAGSTRDISLSGAFSDADGDALSITASSSDDAKATVTVASDGSKLTVAGVAEGTATITVTAQDADGNRVSDTFDVTVTAAQQQQQDPPPNQSPTVSSALGDATVVNESGTKEVSLSGAFDDPDGDELTITAGSSDDGIATVSVASDYSTLTVNAQARGTATITVTADDGNGGTVADTFTVTVKAAPEVAQPLADVTGLEAGAAQDISLSGVFRDADGDSLTITAVSSDDALVGAFVFRNTLTIAALAEGTETITVTAQDADGNLVSDAFEVSVVKKDAALIAQMYQWRNDPEWVDHKEHTDRWDRALLAFGETVADTSLTPMSASEAQELADKGWNRWVEVAEALRDIESG